MGEVTGISWCDHTFNPWIGCTKISPACDGCYAAALMGMDGRMKRVEWGEPGKGTGTRSRTAPSNWAQPLKWERQAKAAGETRFVFCSSLADVFDNEVPPEWRADLFDLIRATPHLTWLLLTKRPGMIPKLFAETITPERRKALSSVVPLGQTLWPPNAAIGCTVVNQEEADRDVPKLLAAKAALNPAFAFLSMEPLLGPVDLTRVCIQAQKPGSIRAGIHLNALSGRYVESGVPYHGNWDIDGPAPSGPGLALDWVITGGETDQSQHKARPTHPNWLRSIRDQCAEAGVPYHHKQNGEWAACRDGPGDEGEWPTDLERYCRIDINGNRVEGGWPMQKVGKNHAGRLLDGVLHEAMPNIEGGPND